MEIKKWHKVFNVIALILSLGLGLYFLLPSSDYEIGFGLGALVIASLFILNRFFKINITIIFVVMIAYMLIGLLNWPLKEGVKVGGFADLVPALLPFVGFIVLALLYWENRNKF
jgi:hypothetical protein